MGVASFRLREELVVMATVADNIVATLKASSGVRRIHVLSEELFRTWGSTPRARRRCQHLLFDASSVTSYASSVS
jgi:hypothetical protein